MNRIGVMTSGGDAPGMNAAIRSVVRTCAANGLEAVGIHRGFTGLLDMDYVDLDARSVNGITSKGGTMLYSSRCPRFKEKEYQERGAENCRRLGLEGLVVIGGDGSFRGAKVLSDLGINTIAIPATIDNDIGCSHYSIGFDTAANTAVEMIDKLRDTMQSHERTSIVEVMGHGAGHLAVYIALAVGATTVLIPEKSFNYTRDIEGPIVQARMHDKHHHLIIVSEGVADPMELDRRIQKELGIECRVTILGHIQRGGSPTARDRVMATRMGHLAVESLLAGKTCQVVCYRDSHLLLTPIVEALKMEKSLDEYMYRVAHDVSF